ncbi:MAG: Nif3-like dinuclear metal center hexameric protein [Gammaproteobacteria bacterium]
MTRSELEQYLDVLLRPGDFDDYGPNGLQVEGKPDIRRIAFAVSATQESVEIAAARDADAMLVHHGLFWKFHGPRVLTGAFARRIFPLVRQQINLFAYHLPLDAHPEVGNAASLAALIGLDGRHAFGDFKGCPTGVHGSLDKPLTATRLKENLERVLQHPVMLASPDPQRIVRKVGIITGGANGDWPFALRAGLDAYITGEMSEHDWHEAREAGLHMFAGGHHATERYGIQALLNRIQMDFPVECFFIDSQNPA